MQIKFKLKDEQNIEIIAYNGGEEKVIGAIFTPAGSGRTWDIKTTCTSLFEINFFPSRNFSFP